MKRFIIDLYNSKEYNKPILFYSLFSAWLLSLPFEGQILSSLYLKNSLDLSNLSLIIIGVLIIGLISAGYFVDNIIKAKKVSRIITYLVIFGSIVFFFPPSSLWTILILILSFLGGVYIGTWGFYYRLYAPGKTKIEVIGKVLILSNLFMILINVVTINISPFIGLGVSILFLILSIVFLEQTGIKSNLEEYSSAINKIQNFKPIVLLLLFIVILTITSGLMYTVINPAFSYLKTLTSWYWAVPYIFVIYILIKSPNRINKSYVLYFAITLIGLSFLLFLILDRSWISYIVINSLMMGAYGVCDLFWWSIIGELFDYVKNPAKLFGLGLAANILGILIGSTLGSEFININYKLNPAILAMIIIFIILLILHLLYKYLSFIISDHIFLIHHYYNEEISEDKKRDYTTRYPDLTNRENEIVNLLFTGRTYKMIAEELFLSENTIKTHIKNIYSKHNVQSKAELIKTLELKPIIKKIKEK
ncbi:MAG: helix-turn-helix transcriptional regulator [Tissierellia bacterium]|nr:helix-turn-helix transcriptional regulator [Tissierellia bacterium]